MEFFENAVHHIGELAKENRSTIFTVLEVVGIAATFIFTVKANRRANERRHEAMAEKGEELSDTEIVKAEAPAYILSAAVGVATIGLTIADEILTKRETGVLKEQNGTLSAALGALGGLYYGRINAEKDAGVEKEVKAELLKKVDDIPPWKDLPEGTAVFYDQIRERFFTEKWETMYYAESKLKTQYAYDSRVSLNYWYRCMNNPDIPPESVYEGIGWAKWHVTKDDVIPPVTIDVAYIPQERNGMKYYEVEFLNSPDGEFEGY